MLFDISGIMLDNARVASQTEVHPIPQQVAVVVYGSMRILVTNIGFVITAPGAQGPDTACGATELAAILRGFDEGRELLHFNTVINVAIGRLIRAHETVAKVQVTLFIDSQHAQPGTTGYYLTGSGGNIGQQLVHVGKADVDAFYAAST